MKRLGPILALAALCACGEGRDDLRTLRRIRLPAEADSVSTLAVDGSRRAWVGMPGRFVVVDTAGRVAARLPVPGGGPPRLLWRRGRALYLALADGRLAAADARTGKVVANDRRRGAPPAARDPKGRWVFATIRRGGVLGLDPATLEPRWGWPEPGSDAGAVAVSPLGDRVYLALEGDRGLDLPRTVQTRDALTGRVLDESVPPEHVEELVAAADGTLFGRGGRRVFALRPGPGGLTVRWDVPVAESGLPRADAVRVSPDGARVAVIARGRGGGLRLLDARTGAVVGRTDEAPLDAAFGGEGRLWILNAREVRVVR